MSNICGTIKKLADYAVSRGLAEQSDRDYLINGILAALRLGELTDDVRDDDPDLETMLGDLCTYAYEAGLIESDSVAYRDLFDTSLMGILTPRPSEVIARFTALCKESPEAATDYFYKLCRDCDYIRTYRVKKDLKWVYESDFGPIDITVNLSKPEKDPKAIAAAKSMPQSGYPKCLLCHENVGYAGNPGRPARQNLRQIPLTLDGEVWYLQYSPYVYYNEHCIVLCGEHVPMRITRSTFEKQLSFVEQFPHYFLGSNADLPIVGGSILTHDHMQGGRYTFAMTQAPIEKVVTFRGFEDVEAGIVHWPLSTIRLRSEKKERLVELADRILAAWRGYTDESAFVFAETNGEPHNTITPIARYQNGKLELDLVLRNNITTEEYPLGVYHPHPDKHNIKKENIGLIEVMGLAVLPSRLKKEIEIMKEYILGGKDFSENADIAKHKAWFEAFRDKYRFTADNTEEILRQEIGKTFAAVLEDAGVYKCTEEGRAAFMRFVASV